MPRKILISLVAIAAAVSLGLPNVARAQITKPRPAGRASLTVKPSTVPAGLVTGVNVSNPCAAGTKPSSVSGFPKPIGTTRLQAIIPAAPWAIRIAGVWPPPGPPSYTIKVTCPNGVTKTGTVTVEKTPVPNDFAGVGSDTMQNVMDQFSADYNANPPSGSTGNLFSWDATNPISGAMGDPITIKTGCNPIPRPDGSSAGITALTTENGMTSGHPCIDFARSSRARATGDPTSITFITLAGDAVTYSTQPGSNAPDDLTTPDLTGIYNCAITHWNQIPGNSGGSPATIAAMLPQSGSGTRAFFLSAIGLTAPGPCVSTSATRQGSAGANDNTLQENEGVASSLNMNKANVIFPFSAGKYLAESYHSANCFNTTCSPSSRGIICTPSSSQNLFGCDIHGTMQLNAINGTQPLTCATHGAPSKDGILDIPICVVGSKWVIVHTRLPVGVSATVQNPKDKTEFIETTGWNKLNPRTYPISIKIMNGQGQVYTITDSVKVPGQNPSPIIPAINPKFTSTFARFLYEVVKSKEFTIPTYLRPLFSSTGWVCANATAQQDVKNYGFRFLPAGTSAGDCGSLS